MGMETYKRKARKAIWLSQQDYDTLLLAKTRYEEIVGPVDWAKFLVFASGFMLGSDFFNQSGLSREREVT